MMKRDLDLIKDILLMAEERPPGELVRDFSALEKDDVEISEHVWLAERAGLLEAVFSGNGPSSGHCAVKRLTPAGHDFIAHARAPAVWNEAKGAVAKAGVGATVQLMQTALTHIATAAVTTMVTRGI